VFRKRGTSLSWCRSGFDHLGRPRMVDWSSQPDVALSGVGGHSVHGLEDSGVQTNQPMGERFRLQLDGNNTT
jgi:hypothetical protein